MSRHTLLVAGCVPLLAVLSPTRAHPQLGQPTIPPRHHEQRGICDAVDSRTTPPDNPCIVRITIQDANGVDIGVGTGFMIGPSCMLTVRHNVYQNNGQPTGAKMVVEQTPPDDPGTTQLLHHPVNHPKRFEIPSLAAHIAANEIRTGAANATEEDWAVVRVPNNGYSYPGDGCDFEFNCDREPNVGGLPTRVTGYGDDTDEPNKRLTLQTHEDVSVAYNPAALGEHILAYMTDTEGGNSGSPVLDADGRILGIHFSQCGGSPNANLGVSIRNPRLQDAIEAMCGERPCPKPVIRRPSLVQHVTNWVYNVETDTVLVYIEDFNNGTTCTPGSWVELYDPAGNYAQLYPGNALVQEGACARDLSCVWAFISGSTHSYACGGFPAQTAVPYVDANGNYIANEIVSPQIPWLYEKPGTLRFDVYSDLPLDNLVFYDWAVRSVKTDGTGGWRSDDRVYYGNADEWITHEGFFGHLLEPGLTHIQIRLGVYDMAGVWAGLLGTGACHSHAPLFDNVRVYYMDAVGPQWQVNEADLFQDNFAADGTVTGSVRADVAWDKTPWMSYAPSPGDSATVSVGGLSGLATTPGYGGAAVYCYVRVDPPQGDKAGPALSGNLARWPVVGSTGANGNTWYCLRMDSVRTDAAGNTTIRDRYCVDLNDNLFTPGDRVEFFFAASSPGYTTYWSEGSRQSSDIHLAAAGACEMTCLPDLALDAGTDILYVDAADGRGVQELYDTAFAMLGIAVDRYDIRDPSMLQRNGPGSRVVDVANQLFPYYRKIIWASGDVEAGVLGESPSLSSDDGSMLFEFLATHPGNPGLYLAGDHLVECFAAATSPGATALRVLFIDFLMATNAYTAQNPTGVPVPGGIFAPVNLIAYGGCPSPTRFNALQAMGVADLQMSFDGNPNYGMVVSQTTPTGASTARVVLSSAGLERIHNLVPNGIPARAQHLYDIITYLQNTVNPPVGDESPRTFVTRLGQNFPNPFNPETAIPFSLARRARVNITIYDVGGRRVRQVLDDDLPAGAHRDVRWDGRDDHGSPAASGVYFYRLKTAGYTETKRMVLLK